MASQGAYASINEVYDHSVPQGNTKHVLIERKQVDKIESKYNNIA